MNSVPVAQSCVVGSQLAMDTVKKTGTLRTGLPSLSNTFATIRLCRVGPCPVIRGGSAVMITRAGRALPIVTVTLLWVAAAELTTLPELLLSVEEGVVDVGVGASPPDTPVTVAVPERLSDTRFTRATPSFVLPCS